MTYKPTALYLPSHCKNKRRDRRTLTPNEAVVAILAVSAVSMSGIWLTANWAEKKIRRMIATAEPANIVTGCTFIAEKGQPAAIFKSTWDKDA